MTAMTEDRIESAARILTRGAHGTVRRDAPIGPLTSYRIGGPAAVLLEAAGEEDLHALHAAVDASGAPLLMVGRGSNMLISDDGFDGIVCRLGAGFRWSRVEAEALLAGAAMPLPGLATLAADHELGGFEFGVAIPASLGGAVRMNAGAHGSEIADVLESAQVFVLTEGRSVRIDAADAGFVYRSSSLPADGIVTAATVRLRRSERDVIEGRMREAREWRRATQPLNLPNGGSVFKNPPGDKAGRLVEDVVGKGERVGGARVSEVHANFIVTEPSATADEVYTLIKRIQRAVLAATGIELEPELKLVGTFREVIDGSNAG